MKNQTKFFAYQIGHIEIGKVTKFGGVWEAILKVLGLIYGLTLLKPLPPIKPQKMAFFHTFSSTSDNSGFTSEI